MPGSSSVPRDYTPVTGTLSFPVGVARRVISVATLPDADDENDETVVLELQNAIGTNLGAQRTADLVIRDDDAGGEIAFAQSTFPGSESGRALTLTIVRTAGVASGVTVECQVTGRTAAAGVDYVEPSPNPITPAFRAGRRVLTMTLPIIADDEGEGAESIDVTLQNPTG
jgi:hypothetical protein